ncbi:hypothetical protein HTZ84_21020 [Haloterrigena sp. SYSU A558-1]|uniref:Uncharacterized protein n=1 Tax=Haloterrigena gelatinilytica TaxID=2741724 RepID=A0ABX2LM65_9EURY|nr:hypothetical protein [Haloterrigena gelatinilytica]NUC74747.1 hypothetical protein [Haloterrigena gelatinilytica]
MKLKLPGAEDQRNEDIMRMIEAITADHDKLIRFTIEGSISKEITIDAMYAFESQGEDIYALYVPRSFRKRAYRSKQALHDTMLDGLEAEIIDMGDLEDEDRKRWYNDITAKQDPITSVYVFVKTTDDGRYKDHWKYYRGNSEEDIREHEDLPKPSADEKWVYYCLGNIAELRENAEKYSFDLRKHFNGAVPTDLLWLTDENELRELRETVSANHE